MRSTLNNNNNPVMTKHIWLMFLLLPVFAIGQVSNTFLSPQTHAWQIVGQDTFSAGFAHYINLVFSPSGEPYVAYLEGVLSKLTMMKYNGNQWAKVGNSDSVPQGIEELSFVFSPSGQPYVAFVDFGVPPGVNVMKFDGINWVYVGIPSFSMGEAHYVSLAFSPTDLDPYVAYVDYSDSAKITVRKFDGNNWINVGSTGFTTPEATYVSLALSSSGEPYVAYQMGGLTSDYNASVMKYDGTNWVHVGNEYISPKEADGTTINFSSSGEPYLAYVDWNYHGATVKRFDGSDWVDVGLAGFSKADAGHLRLAFSPLDHQPSVVYEDGLYSLKATVMHFNGSQWVNTGNPGFSPGLVGSTSIAFNPSGIPYVAYSNSAPPFNSKATVEKFDSVYIGINEHSNPGFLIYPDPASTKITVRMPEKLEKGELSILNPSGQICMTNIVSGINTTIDISTLPSGLYFIRLNNDKKVAVGKFIKQ